MKVRIGVLFGDNDFFATFTSALQLIGDGIVANHMYYTNAIYDKPIRKINRPYIAALLNICTTACYFTAQNPLVYNEVAQIDYKDVPEKWDYLHVKKSMIYIDNNLDKLLKKNDGWFNAELYILDIDTDRDEKQIKIHCL